MTHKTAGEVSAARCWSMLAVSLTATLCANMFANSVAFLIPAMHAQRGTSLVAGGLLASMPNFGMLVTLVAWGYLLDVFGERVVITVGLALTAAAGWAAASAQSMTTLGILLFGGGMAAASTVASSGRLVTGWFPPHQRALAMGIRQTAQPLGIGLAAVVLPRLAAQDFVVALEFPAAICAVAAAVAVLVIHDPPRPAPTAVADGQKLNPYRGSAVLWRIHLASALLMVPQPVVLTFGLMWLIGIHRWSVASASAAMALSQMLGALARTAAGRWSDRIGSRMRPLRTIAVATTVTLLVLAVTDHLRSPLAVTAMVVALAVTGDNGLPFTAIPEIAGPFWSGRALGMQNTVERLMVAIGPPAFGGMIAATGYPPAFAVCAVFPLAALPWIPSGARAR